MINSAVNESTLFEPVILHTNSFCTFIKYSSLNKKCENIAFEWLKISLNEHEYSFSDLKLKVKDAIKDDKQISDSLKMSQLKNLMLYNRLEQCWVFAMSFPSELTFKWIYMKIDLNGKLDDSQFIDELRDAIHVCEEELKTVDLKNLTFPRTLLYIPEEIGKISENFNGLNLHRKDFFSREFRLANFSNLTELSLEECNNLPSNLFTEKLWSLKVVNCSLEKFSSLKKITNVAFLELRNIGLVDVPEFFINFENLQELDLANNKIQMLPQFIVEKNLNKLVLVNNPIKSLPENLSLKGLYTSAHTKLPGRKEEAVVWHQELKKRHQARSDKLHDKDSYLDGMLTPEEQFELDMMQGQIKNLEEQFEIH